MSENIIGVIPCHLASVRFPRKILHPFADVPMIEHVRRRALMSKKMKRVIVATSDQEIADVLTPFGAEVVMTGQHLNGTSRVAEAVRDIDCSNVILLQGDEPLLLPAHLDALIDAITAVPTADAWNVTAPILAPEELDRHSFVKCAVSSNNRIMFCFRRSPSYAEFEAQKTYIRKILGLFAFRKDVLLRMLELPRSVVEEAESIEQMRMIEDDRHVISVPVDLALPSVNEPHEADIVLKYIEEKPEQKMLLERVLSWRSNEQCL